MRPRRQMKDINQCDASDPLDHDSFIELEKIIPERREAAMQSGGKDSMIVLKTKRSSRQSRLLLKGLLSWHQLLRPLR